MQTSEKEIWLPVNIPGRGELTEFYSVSSNGRIMNNKTKHILAALKSEAGYRFFKLSYKGKVSGFYAHRLLALAFIPNPESKPCVNHKDGDRANNSLENLEWNTSGENARHSVKRLGMSRFQGENNFASKLAEAEVKEIRAWWKTGDVTQASIAAQWGISFQHVSDIVNGKRWAHIA